MTQLFMTVVGATVPQRLIEQHDVVFATAEHLHHLIPVFQNVWPEGKVHIDAYREITVVQDYQITVRDVPSDNDLKLYFFNLGGYVPDDMEEHHHKALIVAASKSEAIAQVKQTEFYQNRGFKGAESHIDDAMQVDIDDMHIVNDLLQAQSMYLHITPNTGLQAADVWKVGYLSLSKLAKRGLTIEA